MGWEAVPTDAPDEILYFRWYFEFPNQIQLATHFKMAYIK